MSNPLINVYKRSRQERIDNGDRGTDVIPPTLWRRNIYVVVFGVLGLAVSILTAYSADRFVENLSPGAAAFLVSMVALLALVILFQSLFLKDKKIQYYFVIFEIGLILIHFIGQFSLWFVSGIALFTIATLVGVSFAKRNLNDSFKVHFIGYSYRFLSAFFNGFTLFVACATVGLYQNAGGISERALSMLYAGSAPLIGATFGVELTNTTTVSGAISNYVGSQLNHLPDFVLLSPTQKSLQVASAVKQVQSQLAAKTGVNPKSQETMLDYLYRLIDVGLSKIKGGEFGWSALLSLFVLGALLVKSLLFLLKFPTIFVSYLIYRVLLLLKVIRIEVESKDKEYLYIK